MSHSFSHRDKCNENGKSAALGLPPTAFRNFSPYAVRRVAFVSIRLANMIYSGSSHYGNSKFCADCRVVWRT